MNLQGDFTQEEALAMLDLLRLARACLKDNAAHIVVGEIVVPNFPMKLQVGIGELIDRVIREVET